MKSERVNVYKCLGRSANYTSVVVVTVTKVTVMVTMVMAAMAMVTMTGTVRQDRERCSTEDSQAPRGRPGPRTHRCLFSAELSKCRMFLGSLACSHYVFLA